MENPLDALYREYNQLKEQLRKKREEKKRYQAKADEIGKVYDLLFEDKRMVEGYKRSLDQFFKERYDEFRGSQHNKVYKPSASDLSKEYEGLISRIDKNLDDVNKARAEYQNKAFQCNGPIGYLESLVNNIWVRIQNFTN